MKKQEKLDHITITILYISLILNLPMYSIHINYFIVIIYNGYDNLVHWTLTTITFKNEKCYYIYFEASWYQTQKIIFS